MPHLIIGHTTESSTRIWIRGDAEHRHAHMRVSADADGLLCDAPKILSPDHDFTAVVPIDELRPESTYSVVVGFGAREGDTRGDRGTLTAQGSFRTFPEPGSPHAFSFLHGSCNLSIASITNLGSLVLGALGSLVGSRSLERPRHGSWRWALELANAPAYLALLALFAIRWARSRRRGEPPPARPRWRDAAVQALFVLLHQGTGFQQPKPVLPSPFGALAERLGQGIAPEERPAFMIHAGDQIYFDFPFARREPERDAYRRAYREAWFEDPTAATFLASCPQYMILDDHEIVDRFALDRPASFIGMRDPADYLGPAREAYCEYVQSRQPETPAGSLGYEFACGAARFFVLDTRTQRHHAERRMLDEEQLCRLEKWLGDWRRELKFVVSSVPFVAELRPASERRGGSEERDDKWSGRSFRAQRDRILEHVHRERVGPLVFLVGDMHCSYHATLRIGTAERRATIHELAGGPIHQLQFSKRRDFHDDYRGTTGIGKIPFRSFMRQFHGAAAGVLQVTVRPDGPEVRWRVLRTSRGLELAGERPLSGRIAFQEPS